MMDNDGSPILCPQPDLSSNWRCPCWSQLLCGPLQTSPPRNLALPTPRLIQAPKRRLPDPHPHPLRRPRAPALAGVVGSMGSFAGLFLARSSGCGSDMTRDPGGAVIDYKAQMLHVCHIWRSVGVVPGGQCRHILHTWSVWEVFL